MQIALIAKNNEYAKTMNILSMDFFLVKSFDQFEEWKTWIPQLSEFGNFFLMLILQNTHPSKYFVD